MSEPSSPEEPINKKPEPDVLFKSPSDVAISKPVKDLIDSGKLGNQGVPQEGTIIRDTSAVVAAHGPQIGVEVALKYLEEKSKQKDLDRLKKEALRMSEQEARESRQKP